MYKVCLRNNPDLDIGPSPGVIGLLYVCLVKTILLLKLHELKLAMKYCKVDLFQLSSL
jgi:hypothetical protein